jgi:hypothetical protein
MLEQLFGNPAYLTLANYRRVLRRALPFCFPGLSPRILAFYREQEAFLAVCSCCGFSARHQLLPRWG